MQRWDLVRGALASMVAVAGLLLSVRLGNTHAAIFGFLDRPTQVFLAVLAAFLGIMVAVKTQLRYSRTDPKPRVVRVRGVMLDRHGAP